MGPRWKENRTVEEGGTVSHHTLEVVSFLSMSPCDGFPPAESSIQRGLYRRLTLAKPYYHHGYPTTNQNRQWVPDHEGA